MPRRLTRRRAVSSSTTDDSKRKIYAWAVVGRSEVNGVHPKYTVLLWADGHMSCDCPGWIFHHVKSGDCRHIKERYTDAQEILELFQAGRPLPRVDQPTTPEFDEVAASQPNTPPPTRRRRPQVEEDLPYGRRIVID
jgi:hypothetical protein